VYLNKYITMRITELLEGIINVPELSKRIIAMRAKGITDDQIRQQLQKEGIPSRYIEQAFAGAELNEHGKASRELCKSSKPDDALGASMLASCKSQGLRARDGNKSHKLGKAAKSRVKVGGHKIKGHKYGGPLPDWS
jgi:hypothetical protein